MQSKGREDGMIGVGEEGVNGVGAWGEGGRGGGGGGSESGSRNRALLRLHFTKVRSR